MSHSFAFSAHLGDKMYPFFIFPVDSVQYNIIIINVCTKKTNATDTVDQHLRNWIATTWFPTIKKIPAQSHADLSCLEIFCVFYTSVFSSPILIKTKIHSIFILKNCLRRFLFHLNRFSIALLYLCVYNYITYLHYGTKLWKKPYMQQE